MKKSVKRVLVVLPIVIAVLAAAFVVYNVFFKKPKPRNGEVSVWSWIHHIVYNGQKYMESEDGLFFELQENWEELDSDLVEFHNFTGDPFSNLVDEKVYYDTDQPYVYDIFLTVDEAYLKEYAGVTDHSNGYQCFHVVW